jgi:DNA-binding PadR family transcriptional regulator
MTENKLLFLGLLKDGPKHGYEIKRLIKKELAYFIKIETTSIYYPLRQLEKEGLIIKKSAQSGKRPEKFIYQLTDKGEEEFKYLLGKSLVTIERPFFNIDLALYFIGHLKSQEAKHRLQIRLNLFKKLQKQLTTLAKSIKSSNRNLVNILNHDQNLLAAEIESLSRLLSSLN